MSTLRPYSKSRLARIASGKEKIGRSTFKQKSMAEIIAGNGVMRHEVQEALFGKAKALDKPITLNRKDAITLLDNVFSQFIRLRDSDERGYLKCFICDKPLHWAQAENMHFMPRVCMPTRYDEIACQAGCHECNSKPNGNRDGFAIRLDDMYGGGTAEALCDKSKNTSQEFKTKHILALLATYRDHVARIRKAHPGKFIKP